MKNVPIVDPHIILGSKELLVIVQKSRNGNSAVRHRGISPKCHCSQARRSAHKPDPRSNQGVMWYQRLESCGDHQYSARCQSQNMRPIGYLLEGLRELIRALVTVDGALEDSVNPVTKKGNSCSSAASLFSGLPMIYSILVPTTCR